MTVKEKTSEQLVSSVRKSKTGAVSRKASRPAADSGSRPSAAAESTAKAGKATKPSTAPAEEKVTETVTDGDSFNFGRRVWPD